jgi:hypothetical protein
MPLRAEYPLVPAQQSSLGVLSLPKVHVGFEWGKSVDVADAICAESEVF